MIAKVRRGFSLVELVIVIVILGVIAAIAVPRISRGAKGADESSVRQNLAILRSAIEMYSAEHGGDFPGDNEADFKAKLLQYTKKDGSVSTSTTGGYIYGPYLRKQIPPLPVGTNAGSTTVSVGNTGPVKDIAGGYGWVYNHATGEIIANADNATESDPNTTYDQW